MRLRGPKRLIGERPAHAGRTSNLASSPAQPSPAENAVSRLESLVHALGGHWRSPLTVDSVSNCDPSHRLRGELAARPSGVMRRADAVGANVVSEPALDAPLMVNPSSGSGQPSRDVVRYWHQDPILRAVLDALPFGVWLVDSSGVIAYGNTAAQGIWAGARYVGPDAFGEFRAWWSNTGEPIRPEDWAAARAIDKGETSIDEEIEIECFDGARKFILNSAVPLFDDQREITGAIVLNQDITERKHAEAELRRREAELREAQRIGLVGSWNYNSADGVHWSEEMYVIFGIAPRRSPIAPKSILALVHADDRHAVSKWIRACAVNEQPTEIEFSIVRPDGAIRVVFGRGRLAPDSASTAMRIAGTVQDITDRKRAEAERERLFSALDQAADIVYITSPDGVIEYANSAFEATTGYARNEAIGKTPRILNSGKHGKEFYENLWNTILAGHPWRGRLINRRKNGTEFIEDMTIAPSLDAAGRVVHFVAVSRDVTEQLQMADRVTVSQKMEAIGTLAGGVAHDFNNLLAVILGYTRFAVSSLDPSDPLLQDLEEVLNAGERAAALTRQLLAFGRKQVLEPRIIDCNEVIEKLASMLRRLIGEHIVFKLWLAADLGTVTADPAQLEQAIMNLVVNARDAMPNGGTLVVETTNVDLEAEYSAFGVTLSPGCYVRIAVTDDGCGMDNATKERIFEPFFTTKPKNKGTGLGLSTVYGIMKQSGGCVGVESAVGQGTCFELYFPRRAEVAQARTLPRRDSRPSAGTETILVVEDEDAVRRSIVRMLEAAGYFVLSAANAEEANYTCARYGSNVKLLLTDVIMPHVSGVQLAQQLREAFPHIRVLFMSGYPDDALDASAGLGSTVRFINKPFETNQLEATVREILDETQGPMVDAR